jgi:hypothetical protein
MSTGVIRVAAAALACATCLAQPGCISVNEGKYDSRPPTVGQELRDLKTARDEGAIEPEQYQVARNKVLARLDKPVPCK